MLYDVLITCALIPIVIPGTDTAQKRRKASCLGGQFLSINEISRISDDSTSHQASVIRRRKSKQCNMQSSPPFISFTTQEEGTDDDRYRGKEEDSTILKEHVSAQEEKHVKTMRDDVHDSIPQPSERCGRRKLSQFPEKVCKDNQHYVSFSIFLSRPLLSIIVHWWCLFDMLLLSTTTSPAYRS